ncbi:hypothetical protein F5X68DRAFT_239343 [Plectosphaerella plurivora]|uniref:F-box domain-containing protein n=1 Tax=Plectosphaerella plurivora TaxID=936078 RepID=A0A9P8VEE8_9PEZI|nr:hypothetical protein F5X68DRAFT_239343 [Plectosphaerella plurivora]
MDATITPDEAPASLVNDGSNGNASNNDHDHHADNLPSASDSDEHYEGNLDSRDAKQKLKAWSKPADEIEELTLYSEPYDMNRARTSLQSAFRSTPTTGLSGLDHLPAEITLMVVHHMDILTFFRFRQVNRRARELASTIKEYNTIATHALEAVRAILRTRSGHNFTIDTLYRKLLSHKCRTCGKFGSFLNLATADRCCINCNHRSARFHVLPPRQFCKAAKITPTVLNQYAKLQLRTVRGSWDRELKDPGSHPRQLIPVAATARALLSAGVIDESTRRGLWTTKSQRVHRLMVVTPFPFYDAKTDTIQRGVYCTFCHDSLEDNSDWDEEWPEEDVHTTGVAELWIERLLRRLEIFTQRGFLTHLEECDYAQDYMEDY